MEDAPQPQPQFVTPARPTDGMNWKSFTVRLIEALRWPFAFVVIFYLLRVQIGDLIVSTAAALRH